MDLIVPTVSDARRKKIVANREFLVPFFFFPSLADHFQATNRKRRPAVKSCWKLTGQRGPSEPSANSTRVMGLIDQLRRTTSVKAHRYFFFLKKTSHFH